MVLGVVVKCHEHSFRRPRELVSAKKNFELRTCRIWVSAVPYLTNKQGCHNSVKSTASKKIATWAGCRMIREQGVLHRRRRTTSPVISIIFPCPWPQGGIPLSPTVPFLRALALDQSIPWPACDRFPDRVHSRSWLWFPRPSLRHPEPQWGAFRIVLIIRTEPSFGHGKYRIKRRHRGGQG